MDENKTAFFRKNWYKKRKAKHLSDGSLKGKLQVTP